MERIMKLGKTVRNNWKKSVVGVIALYYGGCTAKERYDINIVMEAACKEASKYGDNLIQMERNPTVLTVILNPVANKRNAKSDFEKYCEPLLHLAGFQVDVVQTTSEGNAKEIVENLRGTEAIIVAGGDGTLSETVTGLLRRNDAANQFPLGILPLGRTNTLGNTMFPGGKGVDKVKQLIEASMAIVKWNTEWKDAMRIEPLCNNDEETPSRPIYALSSMEWGAFRDTLAKKDKYWMLGSLREYASFVFNGYKDSITWNCSGTIKYTPPCTGCSNCVEKRPEAKRAWSFFTSSMHAATKQDSSQVLNAECANAQELCFKTSELVIKSPNVDKRLNVPSLSLILGKSKYSYSEFVSEGWRRLKGEAPEQQIIAARTVEFMPKESDTNKELIEIDNEEFDVKPVKITLLPKMVKLFCKPQIN